MLTKAFFAWLPLLAAALADPAETASRMETRQDAEGFIGGENKRSACSPGDGVKVGIAISPYLKLSHERLGTTWGPGELMEWTMRCAEEPVSFKLGIYPFDADWKAREPTETFTCTLSGMPENDNARVQFYPGKPYNGVTAASGDFSVQCE